MMRFSPSVFELDDVIPPEVETHRIRTLLVAALLLLIVGPTITALMAMV